MSLVPVMGFRTRWTTRIAQEPPDLLHSMGLTAEEFRSNTRFRESRISFPESHMKKRAAWKENKFKGEASSDHGERSLRDENMKKKTVNGLLKKMRGIRGYNRWRLVENWKPVLGWWNRYCGQLFTDFIARGIRDGCVGRKFKAIKRSRRLDGEPALQQVLIRELRYRSGGG